jgi:hypothetical protein
MTFRTYQYLGHRIVQEGECGGRGISAPFVPTGIPQCATCSLPLVISRAVQFMAENDVRHLVIEGQAIDRLG